MPQYADTYFTSADGLRLFARDYPGPDSNAATLLCLPGLTRNSKDFADLAALVNAEVEEAVAFNTSGQRLPIRHSISLQNLLGEKAVFLLRKREGK